MKRFFFYLIAISLLSCSGNENSNDENLEINNRSKIEFKDFNQKISYCIGLDHAFAAFGVYGSKENSDKFSTEEIKKGMVDYLLGNDLRVPIDARDSIFEMYLLPNGSVDASVVSKSDASYAIGMEEALILVSMLVGRGIDQTIDVDLLVQGVRDGMSQTEPAVSIIEARTEVASYYSKLNLENGEFFLQENAKSDSVNVTESGLQYIVFKDGKGKKPNLTDTCVVHYTGRLIDGREFESTIPSGQPAAFTPLGLIPGWQEALLLMKEGSRYRFFMPYQLAYGEEGSGPIEPFSALVFDIELIEVKRFQ